MTNNPRRGRGRWRLLAGGALGLLAAAVGLIALSHRPRSAARLAPEGGRTGVKAEFDRISLRGRGWELDGDVAVVSADGDHVVLRPVRRAALMRGGKAEVSLRCGRLALDRRSGDMTMEGGVTLETPSGLRLETARLRWVESQGRLMGDEPCLMRLGNAAMRVSRLVYAAGAQRLECGAGVRLATRDSHVTAERLVAMAREREVRLAGDIRGRLAVDERGEFLSKGPAAELQRLLSLPRRGT